MEVSEQGRKKKKTNKITIMLLIFLKNLFYKPTNFSGKTARTSVPLARM